MLFEIKERGELVKREMKPGEAVHVTPGTVHRMTAINDCDIFEVSTPELDDVVRLEDRYGRYDISSQLSALSCAAAETGETRAKLRADASRSRMYTHAAAIAVLAMRGSAPRRYRAIPCLPDGGLERIDRMGSVNKVILVGNLGRDAELRYTPGGAPVATLNLATTEVWNDKGGQKQEKTEWHRIVLWGKSAESLNEYLVKGKQIYVEGRLQTRQWDDKDGNKRYTTEIRGDRVVLLGSAGGGGKPDTSPRRGPQPRTSQWAASPGRSSRMMISRSKRM